MVAHPPQLQLVRRVALGLAGATLLVQLLPLPSGSLAVLQGTLLLGAFLATLQPARRSWQVTRGSERIAWGLLLAGAVAGALGQAAWLVHRGMAAGTSASALPEIGFGVWMTLTAVALALEVSSGDRVARAEMVIDLLLIGTIGLMLAREIFQFLAPLAGGADPFDLVAGSAGVVTSVALGVVALGVLMSPGAVGGGLPRLLLVLGAFVAAVTRVVHAYRLLWGQETAWLAAAWTLGVVVMGLAAAERAHEARGPGVRRVAGSSGLFRTLLVPVIVAYALSLLIRELLAAGNPGGADGLAWGLLALLIVARVTVAIVGSDRKARESSAWERRYKTVTRALGEVVYEWDVDTDRVVRSGDTLHVFGLPADEIDAVPAFDLLHPEDRENAERQVREAVRRGGWFEIEYRIRHAERGYRLIRDRGFCQHEGGHPVRVLGLMADLSDERDSEERLRRAERLASLGSLAAGAAHEINNPLAAIGLAAQILAEDDRLPEDVREDVRTIERQAARVSDVTDRMLVFARRKEGVRSAADLNAIVEDVLRARRYDIETRGIDLLTDLSPELPLIFVDAGQIERALVNIIVNAERALAEVPEGRRSLRISTRPTAVGAAVEVRDTGPGIPEEILPRIFDPFFTTREAGEGTGLGLSMCYSIVQTHHGELRVDSRPGATAFTMELPPDTEEVRSWKAEGAPPLLPSLNAEGPRPRTRDTVGLETLSDVDLQDLLAAEEAPAGGGAGGTGAPGPAAQGAEAPPAGSAGEAASGGSRGGAIWPGRREGGRQRPDRPGAGASSGGSSGSEGRRGVIGDDEAGAPGSPSPAGGEAPSRVAGSAADGAADRGAAPGGGLSGNGRAGAPLRVLVVDDEESVRRLARRFLEHQGHRVDEAADGNLALDCLDETDYDSIVLDLRMPGLSGEGVFDWIRRNRPELVECVTVISGDWGNPETGKAVERIGQPYLYKPFDLRELLRLIER